MAAVVFISIYCGALLFVVGCVRRIVQYACTPLHVRWELYPVPHEKAERAAHGGSYFEETDWWSARRERHFVGELRFMLPEIVLLRSLWQHNRKLWFRSFPFHAGLYLVGAATAASLVSALFDKSKVLTVVQALAEYVFVAGLLLTLVGAMALLVRRVTDSELSSYTTVGDLFNVGMFAMATGLLLIGHFAGPALRLSHLVRALMTFDTALQVPAVTGCGLITGAFMAGYIPFTHMGHFVAKYFTYHNVRWDDAPSSAKPEIAAQIAEQLTYRPTWSAKHVGADGTRTWAEIAITNPTAIEEGRK